VPLVAAACVVLAVAWLVELLLALPALSLLLDAASLVAPLAVVWVLDALVVVVVVLDWSWLTFAVVLVLAGAADDG